MMLRVNLTFCVISVLWTCVLGITYTIKGNWNSRIDSVCEHGKNKTNTYKISDKTINDLLYDSFNEHTIIKVYGLFGVKVTVVRPIVTHVLLLNEYHDLYNGRTYEGQLDVVGYDWGAKHAAKVKIRLTIPRRGLPTIRNYIYAEVLKGFKCAYSISNIRLLKIVQ